MKNNHYVPVVILGIAFAILTNSILWAVKQNKTIDIPAIPVASPTPEYPGMVLLLNRYNWLDTKQRVKSEVENYLMRMIDTAENDGKCLVVSSGHRTLEQQSKVKEKYGDLAEEPGKSEHHTGYAVDLQACPMFEGTRNDEIERPELADEFETLPEYQWLKKNAGKYGFTQSYEGETWHWKWSPLPTLQPPAKSDEVSWYGQEYCDKHNPACITASGEKFDDTKLTVACSSDYQIGDVLKITYEGKTVTARCNDRGGFGKYGIKLDLSKATFLTLAPLSRGVIAVKIEKL